MCIRDRLWTIFLPKTIGNFTENLHNLPSRFELKEEMTNDRSKGIDGHNPSDKRRSELEKEVLKLAIKIASKSNLTIKIGKKAFYKQLEMPLTKAYKYTSEIMTKNAMELDAEEGISAFLEKRKPNWKNK